MCVYSQRAGPDVTGEHIDPLSIIAEQLQLASSHRTLPVSLTLTA